MAGKRSALLWLLKLPVRPYVRWVTGLVALVLLVTFLTGHLGLAARYAAGRWWPFGTPLIGYAPVDARSFALVDMTQPGASAFGRAMLRGQTKARVDRLTEALAIDARWDVLQVMVTAGGARDGALIAARGRFRPGAVAESLEQRGYRAGTLGERPLFTHVETGEALLIVDRSLILYGGEQALSRALDRAAGRADSLEDSEAYERWLDHAGRRHLLLALALTPERQAALSELAADDGARLEAVVLTIDAIPSESEEELLRVALALAPREPAQAARLGQGLSSAAEGLRAGGRLLGSSTLAPLLRSLKVTPDERVVTASVQGTPEQLGAVVEQLQAPQALAAGFAGLVAAGSVGAILGRLGLSPAAPTSPGAPAAPGAQVEGVLRGLLDRLVGAGDDERPR